ncbi:Isochorismatase-like protein, partial [Zopfochytrium polystomum]
LPANTAFFLCDIQGKFRQEAHIYKFDQMVDTASKMVNAASILNVPVVATEQHPKGLGPTVPELNVSKFAKLVAPKTKFSMWIPEVENFVKTSPTSIENVVLFGIESHVCVMQTALDLIQNDLHVIVLADGVSSINKGEIPIAIERMRDAGASISSSESVLFQLMGDANHEKFKEVQNLVKQVGIGGFHLQS